MAQIIYTTYVFSNETYSLALGDVVYTFKDASDCRGAEFAIGYDLEADLGVSESYFGNINTAVTLIGGNTNYFDSPLKMVRGDTFTKTFYVIQNGSPFDLSNCTLRMTFKWSYGDADNAAFLQLISPNGIQITNAPDGQASFTLTPAQTSSLPNYDIFLLYDIQVETQGGQIYTVSRGTINIVPDVTITI